MHVATWNIGGGYVKGDSDLYDKPDLQHIIMTLKHINADIIGLQESHSTASHSQAATIAAELGHFFITHAYAPSHIEKGQQLTLAVLSRHPIRERQYIPFPNPRLIYKDGSPSHDKGMLIAVLEDRTHIACGHTVPFHTYKRDAREFPEICRAIESALLGTPRPGIALLDLNDPDAKTLLPDVMQEYADALPPGTTTPKGRKNDYILLSHDWAVRSAGMVETLTDHHLCYADVELESSRRMVNKP